MDEISQIAKGFVVVGILGTIQFFFLYTGMGVLFVQAGELVQGGFAKWEFDNLFRGILTGRLCPEGF